MPIEHDSYIVNQKDIPKGGTGDVTQEQMEAYVLEQTSQVMEQADSKINQLMMELSTAKDDILALDERVKTLEAK